VERDGGYFFPAYFGRFIDSLASEVNRLILFVHRSDSPCDPADYQLYQTNIELVLLPEKKSSPSLLFNHRRFTRIFEAYEKDMDAFLVRGPTTLMPFIAESLRQTPVAFLMVGDHLEGLKSSKQALWRKFLIEKFWQFIYRRIERKLSEVMVITNSEKLFEKYEKKAYRIARTHTTTITEDDLWIRENTCTGDSIHLLYSGRIAQEKRIDDIIEAVDLLQKEYASIVLNIVGWDEAEGNYTNYLQRLINGKGLENSIKILGYIPAGEPLMQKYRESDIFVLASSVEGFPRVLWEAMANCLPIVSTNVGSIPEYVGHFIDLVPPNQPELLAEAIKKVLSDKEYRKSIIKKGFSLAQDVTLEKQTKQLVTLIEDYANKSN
jgi:glycosyltransferase involved in cell wall biosynthesis